MAGGLSDPRSGAEWLWEGGEGLRSADIGSYIVVMFTIFSARCSDFYATEASIVDCLVGLSKKIKISVGMMYCAPLEPPRMVNCAAIAMI